MKPTTKKIPITFASLIIVSVMLIISSCNGDKSEKYERKVYLDFKLGESVAKTIKIYNELMSQTNYNKKYSYFRYTHSLWNNTQYYSAPQFIHTPEDTIISTIKVYYFINPKDGDEIIDEARQDRLFMSFDDNNITTSKMVYDDISKDIETKYGRYNHIDTIVGLGSSKYVIKSWYDKDGVNITIVYAFNVSTAESLGHYNLRIEFILTDELKSKLIKKKSIY